MVILKNFCHQKFYGPYFSKKNYDPLVYFGPLQRKCQPPKSTCVSQHDHECARLIKKYLSQVKGTKFLSSQILWPLFFQKIMTPVYFGPSPKKMPTSEHMCIPA